MAKLTAPSRNPQIEAMLASMEFTWDYVVALPMSHFDEEASLHNQARVGKPVDKNTVERYVTALNNGDIFPAIICAERKKGGLLIVDGNHRFQAFKEKRKASIDAYVIRGASPQAITRFTFIANTKHGLPTTQEDRIEAGLYMMDAGLTAEEAAKQLGLKASQLRTAMNLVEANRRASEAGLPMDRWDKLIQASRLRLNQIEMNEAFAAMGQLAIDAKLSSGEIHTAVNEIRKLRSTVQQTEYINGLRVTYAERMQLGGMKDNPGLGRQVRTPRMLLGMALGQMKSLRSPESIVERMTQDDKLHYLRDVEEALTKLTEIRDALKK